MLFTTLIYVGGVTYLYSYIIYYTLTNYQLQNSLEESSNSSYDDDDENSEVLIDLLDVSSEDDDSYQEYDELWKNRTIWTFTFNKLNPHSPSTDWSIFNSDTLQPKKVRFHPISSQHNTFSKEDYRRRNELFFSNLRLIKGNPDKIAEIHAELDEYINNEMEVAEQVQEETDQEITEESKEEGTEEEYEETCKESNVVG